MVTLGLSACTGSLLDPFNPTTTAPENDGTDAPASSPGPTTTSSADAPAPNPPAPNPPAPNPPPPVEEFSWGLPDGPRTPDDTYEDDFYAHLVARDCANVAEVLVGKKLLSTGVSWAAIDSPRGVLLYYAGAQACLGNLSAARKAYDAAESYGWQGVFWPEYGPFSWDCQVLRSVTSVLKQVERSTVACTGGSPLRWPDPASKDNPLTAKVEAVGGNDGGVDPGPASPDPTASASPDPSASASASAGAPASATAGASASAGSTSAASATEGTS